MHEICQMGLLATLIDFNTRYLNWADETNTGDLNTLHHIRCIDGWFRENKFFFGRRGREKTYK